MEIKELTIVEKAKRYDEVIPQLKGLLEGIHEEKCDIMEEDIIKIFPELKESEDERIRKAMLDFFKYEQKEGIVIHHYGVSIDSIIAWLEKQGEKGTNGNEREIPNSEQKPAWSEEDEKTWKEIFSVAARASLRKNPLFGESYDYIKWQNFLKSTKERVQAQPKQEWSERDKEEFQIAIDTLVEAGQHDSAHWLNSLKERYTWKPSDVQMNNK